MAARDDFSAKVKQTVAARAGYRCSNPDCRVHTSGPQADPDKAVNIGVAAHITAAAEGGPRYDQNLSSEERSSIDNAMWLCQNCAKLIDSDEQRYSVAVLQGWKDAAERVAQQELEYRIPLDAAAPHPAFPSIVPPLSAHNRNYRLANSRRAALSGCACGWSNAKGSSALSIPVRRGANRDATCSPGVTLSYGPFSASGYVTLARPMPGVRWTSC